MADREKVINDLSECIEHIRFNEFKKIPFWGNCQIAMMDAVALLKEQEAVEPKAIGMNAFGTSLRVWEMWAFNHRINELLP